MSIRRGMVALHNGIILFGLLSIATVSVGRATTPTATPTHVPTPNFNNVSDPLNGTRVLADVTDLVVVDPWYSTSVGFHRTIDVLKTGNGAVTSESALHVASDNVEEPSPGHPS